jgi:TonB family protein
MMNRIFRTIAFLFAASLYAVSASAQSTSTSSDDNSDPTYFDFQVDQAVKIRVNRAPAYPENLRSAHIDGQVLVQFVVDERGAAEMSTFKVIKATNPEFAEAVRRAISSTAYSPAEIRGKHVKQLVQQPFVFNAR